MTSSCASRRIWPDRLFCYGTLCLPAIMRSVSGCLPPASAATLPGYARYCLSGCDYPAIAPLPGAQVAGVLYHGLGRAQWARLDRYEGHEYQRRRVWLESDTGQRLWAWTYVLRPRFYHRRVRQGWSLAQFRREKLYLYLANRHYP